jgi:hypothetical protein
MASTTFSGPVTSTAGFISGSEALVSATDASLTVTSAAHSGRTVLLDRAAGQAVTLPAATGSGNSYKFFVLTTITSNTTTIKVVDATDVMAGVAIVANDSDATASIFETASTSDTITFDGSTTGGILGATVELQDVATNLWSVRVVGAATGTEATPFSATVS